MLKLIKILCVYVVLFITTASCGRGPHESIEAIVQSFNEFYSKKYDCPVNLVDTINSEKPNIVGWAERNPCKISLKKEYWDKITFEQRELLLYHELGHIYGAWHDDSRHPNDLNRPLSIMNSQLFLEYGRNREEYKEELRHRLNNNP